MEFHVYHHHHHPGASADFIAALAQMENRIMSKIKEYGEATGAHLDTLGKAVDAIAVDVNYLNERINELQNTSGGISAEDQAILDDLQARASALVTKVNAVDELTATPPAPVPVPAVTPVPFTPPGHQPNLEPRTNR